LEGRRKGWSGRSAAQAQRRTGRDQAQWSDEADEQDGENSNPGARVAALGVDTGGPGGTVLKDLRNTSGGRGSIALVRGQKVDYGIGVSRRTMETALRTRKSRNGDRGDREPDQCAPVSDWFHPCLILCHRIDSGASMTRGRAASNAELSR
jgi:hypothetical protein